MESQTQRMLRAVRKRVAVPWTKKGRQKRRHRDDPGGETATATYATSEKSTDTSLDQVKLLTDILVAIADGSLNLPALKTVAALAGKVVAIAQVCDSGVWRAVEDVARSSC